MTETKMLLRPVILESPFSGRGALWTARINDSLENLDYARTCLRDSILRGEAPLASHLLYTQDGVLDDTIASERALGIRAGNTWRPYAYFTIFYTDRGWSPGMHEALSLILNARLSYKFRSLHRTPMLPDGSWSGDTLDRFHDAIDTSPASRFLFRS